MPESTGTYTMKEFAEAIRSKYPDSQLYKTKSDYELSKAFIESDTKNDVYKTKIKDWPTQYPIMEKEGESFIDTMKRAASHGKENLSADKKTFVPPIDKKEEYTGKELTKKVGTTLAAAPIIGAAGTAAMAGTGLAARRLFTDQIVPKIVKGRVMPVVKRALIKQINDHLKQPGTILKSPYGRAVEYYLLTKLGVSKTDIAKLMELAGK